MKSLVVIDLDGVMADFEGALVNTLAREFGLPAMQNRGFFRLEDRFADRPDILARANELVSDPNFYYGLGAIDGVFDFVLEIMESKAVIVVSSRPKSAENFTRRWLRKLGWSPTLFCGISDKAYFLSELGESVDFVVEDNPEQIEKLKRAGFSVLCFDQPWNQGIFPRLYIRSDGEPMLWLQEDEEAESFFTLENKT